MFYWLCWILAFLPLRIFWPTKVIGKRNIPKRKQKAILACNHSSNMDPVLINARLVPNPYILAKKSLFKNKLAGAILKSWRAIPVDRENVDISTIKTVLSVLKKGHKLLIFPQGTRKKDQDDLNGVKNGLVMFALKTNSPIVPMWYVNKPKAFRRNVLLIGKPFYLEGFEGKKLTQDVLDEASAVVIKKMLELRDDYEAQKQKKLEQKLAKKK